MSESGTLAVVCVKVSRTGRGVEAVGATGSTEDSGLDGISDVPGIDVSARATLGILASRRGTGPACASQAAKSTLRAVLKSISQRIIGVVLWIEKIIAQRYKARKR